MFTETTCSAATVSLGKVTTPVGQFRDLTEGLCMHPEPITTPYEVRMEAESCFAFFRVPGTSDSYPAPPASAVEALFKSVAWLRTAYLRPTECRICRPIQRQLFVTNNTTGDRKGVWMKAGRPAQLRQRMLYRVCYQFTAVVVEVARPPRNYNHAHYLQELFQRNLRRGRFGKGVPYLGTSECTPTYLGPWRETTRAEELLNLEIEAFPLRMWSRPLSGDLDPKFGTARIYRGVLKYA
jgi:hypothetical protein